MTANKNSILNYLRYHPFNRRFREYWERSTTPQSTDPIDAQREYVLRAMLLLEQFIVYPIILIYAFGVLAGVFPLSMAIAMVYVGFTLALAWWLVSIGKWRIARFIALGFTYLLALYVGWNFKGAEIVSGFVLTLVITSTIILIPHISAWSSIFIGAITEGSIVFMQQVNPNLQVLSPLQFYAAHITSTFFSLGALVLVVHFFVREYHRSYMEAHRQSRTLEIVNQKLLAEIERRNTLEKELQESLSEKELLLKEIHHRVKNNLQTVAGLLYLQARQTHNPAALEALRNSYARVQSMALVHQQLYQTTNISHIELRSYITKLIEQLRQSYAGNGSIIFRTDIAPVHFNLDTIIPLGLILNELVSNAMKHAFTDRDIIGEIEIIFRQENGKSNLSVVDSGAGFSAEQQALLRERGFGGLTANSLGLLLVQQLTRQLHGEITVTTDPHTRFNITF